MEVTCYPALAASNFDWLRSWPAASTTYTSCPSGLKTTAAQLHRARGPLGRKAAALRLLLEAGLFPPCQGPGTRNEAICKKTLWCANMKKKVRTTRVLRCLACSDFFPLYSFSFFLCSYFCFTFPFLRAPRLITQHSHRLIIAWCPVSIYLLH